MEGREKLYMERGLRLNGMTGVVLLHHFRFGIGGRFFLHSAEFCAPGVSEVTVLPGQQISSAKAFATVDTVCQVSCCYFASLSNFYSWSNIMSKISGKLFLLLELQF
jgi:hypothetical protein